MKKVAIIYGELSTPVQKKALEILSSILLDATMEYPSCIPYSDTLATEYYHSIYIGTKKSNSYINAHSKATLTADEEYSIQASDGVVIIEGYDDAGVLYGCADFYNKYIVKFENTNIHPNYFCDIFKGDKLPDFDHISRPSVKNRGIWTWGHVIYDYKSFIDNMLKLKLNTLTIWNDYAPVNAREMIDYAHSCNIKVIWGFSWLWDTNCSLVNLENLDHAGDEILDNFEKNYAHLGVDGVYFQSFTELDTEKIGNVLIAEAVTDFVNKTAAKFFDRFGEIELQFGIHATSVAEQLEYIKNTDSRIRLYWEDLGSFPFAYESGNTKDYEKTKALLSKVLTLRKNEKFGTVTKGLVCLDWNEFEHLPGAFNIGKCSKAVLENRRIRKKKYWRYSQAFWLTNAKIAFDTVKQMQDATSGNLYITALLEDGLLEDTIMYPIALYSEMLWDCNCDLDKMINNVALRSYVEFA